MKHAMEIVENIYIVALSALVSLAIILRIAVFCYWWIAGAWVSERLTRLTKVGVTDKGEVR